MPSLRRGPRTQALQRCRVKLLLDENLSDRIVPQILDLYPDSTHVKSHKLVHADDTLIWSFAQQNGFTIVSKDADFTSAAWSSGIRPSLSSCGLATAQPSALQNFFGRATSCLRPSSLTRPRASSFCPDTTTTCPRHLAGSERETNQPSLVGEEFHPAGCRGHVAAWHR